MLEELTLWEPRTNVADGIELDDLKITFHRTIRVPDNDKTNELPGSLGHFPLFKIDDYAHKLPVSMARKGGLFMPMYQREAMWIEFTSKCKYAIKIFVGNANAVSGEPAVPTAATTLRRRKTLKQGGTIQDYLFVPSQKWLDGTAVEPGKVRQFVAMPMGSGHSVEAQITGEESTGGIQFEITRLGRFGARQQINVVMRTPGGGPLHVRVSRDNVVDCLERLVREKLDIPTQTIKFTLMDNNIQDGDHIECRLWCVGGAGRPLTALEMNIVAGGLIKQGIVKLPKCDYKKTATVAFNVQILNSAAFKSVTGKRPPSSPISARTYAKFGYPFFSIYEERTSVAGDFSGLRSVAQIDGTQDPALPCLPVLDAETGLAVVDWVCGICGEENGRSLERCSLCSASCQEVGTMKPPQRVGLLNPQGAKGEFRFAWEVAEELAEKTTLF